MIPNSFEQQARLIRLEGFKHNIKKLRNRYNEVNEQFNDLCDDLDNRVITGEYLIKVTNNLTIYLAEMDSLDIKIKEISNIIENLIIELSN